MNANEPTEDLINRLVTSKYGESAQADNNDDFCSGCNCGC